MWPTFWASRPDRRVSRERLPPWDRLGSVVRAADVGVDHPRCVRDRQGELMTEKARKWEDRPMFALDADVTVYWPDVRPCWEEK